jgi:hypothetical protein
MSIALDHTALSDALDRAGALVPASECHGLMVGLCCAGSGLAARQWLDHILGEDEPRNVDGQHCERQLLLLAADTERNLAAADSVPDLLLPDEDEPLGLRADAVAAWCQGFLLGISMAGIGELTQLPADSAEFIRDLSVIARGAQEPNDGAEEDEAAYAEIVEYVRIGALLLRDNALSDESRSIPVSG